jgi:hypothetical protein
MLSIARFSKMDLRPERRSNYSIGYSCEKSAAGMRRCDQWQVIKCSAWRNVQQGECKRTPLVPLINGVSFPKPLQEKEEKRYGKISPCNGQSGSGHQADHSLCLKAGSHNEGKSGYMGSDDSTPCSGFSPPCRTLNLDRKGSTGITAKRGTRHMCEGTPTLDERNELINLGSAACNEKAPRSANVQVGRRSDRISLSRLISGPHTKGRSKDRIPSTKHYRKLETASGWKPRREVGDFTTPEDRNPSFEESEREAKPMNIGVCRQTWNGGRNPRRSLWRAEVLANQYAQFGKRAG